MEKKLANIEREKKEDHLKQLAQKARESRIGVRSTVNEGNFVNFAIVNYLELEFLQKRTTRLKKETSFAMTATRRGRGNVGSLRPIRTSAQSLIERGKGTSLKR